VATFIIGQIYRRISTREVYELEYVINKNTSRPCYILISITDTVPKRLYASKNDLKTYFELDKIFNIPFWRRLYDKSK